MGTRTISIPERLRWLFFWTAVWTAFGFFDYWRDTKHDGSTFSEVVRAVFHTERSGGSLAFLATLNLGSAVFAAHILKKNLFS